MARGIQRAQTEVHVVGAVRVVGSRRPVAADRAGFVDRRPIPVARGRQEHSAMSLEVSRPVRRRDDVGGIVCIGCICGCQTVIAGAPVVGQEDNTRDTVNCCLGISDSRCCAPFVEYITPLVVCQRAPTRSDGGAPVNEVA